MAKLKKNLDEPKFVQGLLYTQPPVPPYSKIRNAKYSHVNQMWERDETYLKWDWTIDEKEGIHWYNSASEEQKLWFEDEIERLHKGTWVCINGEPTYFNNWCYFFHQWFVLLEGNYPTYKDTSLEYFMFFELTWNDPMCLGDIGIKGRRVGLSSMSSSIKLLIGILYDNTLQGIVSKTGTDAKEMFFMVKNGMENLPPFLMPDLNKVTDTEIHIAKPAKRISKNNTKANSDKGKNNRINWLDTAENAYDGRGVKHVTVDEAAKWERVNVQICISKITDTLVRGSVVKGHMSVFSTVNKGDKGGDNFKKVWMGSDHLTGKLDMFGRTETNLKRFFFEGYKGFAGYIGKYGESIVDTPTPEQTEYLKTAIDFETGLVACPNPYIGAKEFLEEARKMKAHDKELYAEQVRKYPFVWQEVFKGANNNCNFDLEALNEQVKKIEDILTLTGATENGRRVKFKKTSIVYPEDSKEGYWYILDLPKDEDRNKSTYIGSIKCPDNTTYGVAGLDSYANAKATVDKGSDACCIIHSRYNALDPENSGMPVAMFIGRPPTKDEFHEQIFWALEYYGIKMLAERAPTDWEDYAILKRLASPLNSDRFNGYLVTSMQSNHKQAYGVTANSKDGREQHLTEMKEYSINNIHKIKFLRLLKDMIGFDIENRTIYDACMAWGYSLMALRESALKANVKKQPKVFMVKRVVKKYF